MVSISPINANQPNFKGLETEVGAALETLDVIKDAAKIDVFSPEKAIYEGAVNEINKASEKTDNKFVKNMLKGTGIAFGILLGTFAGQRSLQFVTKVGTGVLEATKETFIKKSNTGFFATLKEAVTDKNPKTYKKLTGALDTLVNKMPKKMQTPLKSFLEGHKMNTMKDLLINAGALTGATLTTTGVVKIGKGEEITKAPESSEENPSEVINPKELAEELVIALQELYKNHEQVPEENMEEYTEDYEAA